MRPSGPTARRENWWNCEDYLRPAFLRRFKKLTAEQQAVIRQQAQRLPEVFGRPHLHGGLGLRPFGHYFEFRAGLACRVLFLVEDGDAHLVMLGDHEAIRAYVRDNV